MIRSYRAIPDIPTGYALDDVIEIVVPVARTNLITNGSFETNTTSWAAIGGSIARSTAQQYHGAYSLAITPTSALLDGARYDTVSLTSGTTYAYSAKVKGVAGLKYTLNVETNAGVSLGAAVTFTANGRWQWIYGYYIETSSTTRRVTVRKASHASTGVVYVDGVQVEALVTGETVSTYIDGDQVGLIPNQQPPAFYWNGTPHASTSTRSGLTRAGGMVVKLSRYNFLLTAIIGLGLAVPANAATEYARIDGGSDDYTRKPTRQFTLAGTFQASSYQQLRDRRGALAALLDRDLVGLDQRMLIRHHTEDARGNVQSETAAISAKYAGGLDGKSDNHYAEGAALSFVQYLPIIQLDGEAGASLSSSTAITNASRLAMRSPSGLWSALSTGANANIGSLFWASDGKLYAGGEFTTIGGVAANRIAYWDGTAWNAMGTGAAGVGKAVYAIAEGPDGSIYAGGDVSSFGGVANTASLAKWNGSAWSSITPTASANSDVQSIALGPDGAIYVGGSFTTINGVAASAIAKYDGSAWSALAAGSSKGVNAIAFSPGGVLHIVGSTNGSANWGVSRWSGSAWSTLGENSGGAELKALAFGPDGTLYTGGDMSVMGGVTANGIARYNGTSWSAMGSGLTYSSGAARNVETIVVAADGTVYAGGQITSAGGIAVPGNVARWNGSTWAYLDLSVAWTSVTALTLRRDGTLVMGGQGATATGTAAAISTVTNIGSARAYPTLIIRGPTSGTARIYQIVNTTTGRAIYLNLTINAGETVTMRFWPDFLAFQSTFQGNVASAILAGSNEADFFLQPGANTISFFAADSSVTAVLVWRPSYASLDKIP